MMTRESFVCLKPGISPLTWWLSHTFRKIKWEIVRESTSSGQTTLSQAGTCQFLIGKFSDPEHCIGSLEVTYLLSMSFIPHDKHWVFASSVIQVSLGWSIYILRGIFVNSILIRSFWHSNIYTWHFQGHYLNYPEVSRSNIVFKNRSSRTSLVNNLQIAQLWRRYFKLRLRKTMLSLAFVYVCRTQT